MANPKKILICEDEKPMNKALALKLQHAGFAVDSAFDGKSGLELIEKNRYDLVLLDIMMPVLDGFGVLEVMNKNNIKTPVIVLSNLSQQEDEIKAKEMGAKDFFIKSNTPLAEIITHVNKVI